jgi:hypothetical protein
MPQYDFWGKALVCAKAACATSNPHRRQLLVSLAEFWLELARQRIPEISNKTALDIARIECVQTEILGVNAATLH